MLDNLFWIKKFVICTMAMFGVAVMGLSMGSSTIVESPYIAGYCDGGVDTTDTPKRLLGLSRFYTEFTYGPMLKGPGVTANVAYVFQKTTYLGYGAGVDWARYSFDNPYSMLAVYAKFKSYVSRDRNSLFGTIKLGYGIPTSSVDQGGFSSDGGIYAGAGIGFRVGARAPMLEINIGVKVQKAYFEFERPGFSLKDDILFKRLEVGVGIAF